MTEYDDKMVEGWKEELNNLLIFVRHLGAIAIVHFLLHTDGLTERPYRPVSSLPWRPRSV